VSRKGTDHFGSYVRNLSLHFYKKLFVGLEPMTHGVMTGICYTRRQRTIKGVVEQNAPEEAA
jgi:hypothetical protein